MRLYWTTPAAQDLYRIVQHIQEDHPSAAADVAKGGWPAPYSERLVLTGVPRSLRLRSGQALAAFWQGAGAGITPNFVSRESQLQQSPLDLQRGK